MIKLSDYVAQWLAENGARQVFLLPGGGAMHLVDSVGRQAALRYIPMLHEQSAAFAAEAYAECKGEGSLAVCLVTSGPGGTNALTGCACAYLESAPVLFLSGQAKRADIVSKDQRSSTYGLRSLGPQELDITSIVRPITKDAVRLDDPNTIQYDLSHLAHLAMEGRPGPVWLDIPLDIQAAEIDPEKLEPPYRISRQDTRTRRALSEKIQALMGFLQRSRRPVALVGNGARHTGILSLLHSLAIPITTTWKALDLVADDDPLYIGRPGRHGHPGANLAIEHCDLLLSIGARLDRLQTDFNSDKFAPRANLISVDIDPAELRKQYLNLAIRSTVSEFVEMLAKQKLIGACPVAEEWLGQCRQWREAKREPRPFSGFIDSLSSLLQPDDVVVIGGSGQAVETALDAIRITSPSQRVLSSPTLGAMGTGLPAAIGAALASGRRVLCLVGDGGFQLNIQELETVRRLSLPIFYFVMDDSGYGSIRTMQRTWFEGRLVASDAASGLTLPNLFDLAVAYNLPACIMSGGYDSLPGFLSQPGPAIAIVKPEPICPN